MKQHAVRSTSVLLLLALLCAGLSSCSLMGGKPKIEKDFAFSGTDGQSHKVSDFANKPLVLNFWAEW